MIEFLRRLFNWVKGIFKKDQKKQRTLLDEFDDAVASMYRPFFTNNPNISDKKILEVVRKIMTDFKEAAEIRGEVISGKSLMKISQHLVIAYDLMGEDLFQSHLDYEKNLYIESGLRSDYVES